MNNFHGNGHKPSILFLKVSKFSNNHGLGAIIFIINYLTINYCSRLMAIFGAQTYIHGPCCIRSVLP